MHALRMPARASPLTRARERMNNNGESEYQAVCRFRRQGSCQLSHRPTRSQVGTPPPLAVQRCDAGLDSVLYSGALITGATKTVELHISGT